MAKPGVVQYLERTALDYRFRRLAQTDPQASFQGYELSSQERTALLQGGQSLAILLSRVINDSLDAAPLPQPESETGASTVDPARIPRLAARVELLLQLIPVPAFNEDGGLALTHLGALHPLPEPGEALPPKPPDTPETASTAVHFQIAVEAHAVTLANGQTSVGYVPKIMGYLPDIRTEDDTVEPATGNQPHSGTQTGMDRFEQAAAAVRAADPEDIYLRLSELLTLVEAEMEAQ